MSAKEVESGAAAAATSVPARNESSASTAGPTSSHTGRAGSARRQQQASSSSHGANMPASYQPLFGGAYDSDQSTDKDKDAVLPDSCPEAYTLEWGPQQPCVRTPLDVDDVVASSATASSSGVAGNSSSRVDFLRRAWQCNHSVRSYSVADATFLELAASRKLYVLRDTGDEDMNRLICAAFDVDPAFMAAHITGRRYRPRDRPWRGGIGSNATFSACSYVYPQTLTLTVNKPLPADSPRGSEDGVRLDGAGTKAQMSVFQAALGDHQKSQDGGEKTPEALDASAPVVESKTPERSPMNSWLYDSKTNMSSNSVVVFCRASLWTSPRANVLLLDRNPSSTSLEDALLEALDDTMGPESAAGKGSNEARLATLADTLENALSGLVYDQWLDFVDTLSASNRETSHGRINRKLFWGMSQYLEQNLTMARMFEKKLQLRRQQRQHQQSQDTAQLTTDNVVHFYYDEQQFASSDDWKELLSRLERIVALLPLQRRRPVIPLTIGNKARFVASDTSYTVNRIPSGDADDVATRSAAEIGLGTETSGAKGPPAGGINDPSRRPFSQTPEGQNALSRITYMGGILLPFSIIAGVLSMSDPFGPGGRLFWVFWVITLPITCFTLTIIYADDIRKAYIWKPMSHKSLQEAINRGEAVTAEAAAGLARAAERVIDKFSSDGDPEIETEAVTSAARLVDSHGSDGRRARVRVTTKSGPGGPTFYRLSEPSKPESPAASPVPGQQPPMFRLATVKIGRPQVQVPVTYVDAQTRRRFDILAPLRRFWPGRRRPVSPASSSSPYAIPAPFGDDVEPALPSGETVVIDVARPNVDSGTAEMFSRPVSGLNVAAPGCPTILLEQRDDDLQPTAWRRQQLGWAGAFRSIVGYHRPQDA